MKPQPMSPPPAVASLLAAVADIAEIDVSALPDEMVLAMLTVLPTAVNALKSFTAELVTSGDTRDVFKRDGFDRASHWLRGHERMSPHAAKELVDLGRLQRDLPELGAAARAGEASFDHLHEVRKLTKEIGVGKLQQHNLDPILAELAGSAGPAEMAKACQRIKDHADPDGPEPDPDAHERRGLRIFKSGSLWQLRGRLDDEGAATVSTALDSLMPPPTPDDIASGQTAEMRRADALVELGRRALISGDLPLVGGQRPQVGILISPEIIDRLGCPDPNCPGAPAGDAHPTGAANPTDGSPAADPRQRCREARAPLPDDILGRAGLPAAYDRPWAEWVGTVGDAVAARLACDAVTWRAVLHPKTGMPLELGRSVRIVPAWLRKALAARDRGCRWPGCTTPAGWCDAHHLLSWLVGGLTDVDNCILLCRRHHLRVHEDKWFIRLDPETGVLWIWRPTGAPYELAPSTPHVSPTHRDLPACQHKGRRRSPRGPTTGSVPGDAT